MEAGETLLSASDFPAAIRMFREVIEALGDSYYLSDVIDDSDLNLHLASREEQNGRLSIAANLLRGVASSRLALYEIKKSRAG